MVTSLKQGQKKLPRFVFSLGQKIGCGYALILSVLVVGVMSGFLIGEDQRQQALAQEKQALAELRMLHRLQVALLDLSNHQQQIALDTTPSQVQSHYSALLEDVAETEQVWQKLRNYIDSANYRQADHQDGIIFFQKRYGAALLSHLQQMQTLIKQVDFQDQPMQFKQFQSQITRLMSLSSNSSDLSANSASSQFSQEPTHLALKIDQMSRDLAHVIRFSYDDFQRAEMLVESAESLRMQIVIGGLVGAVAIATLCAGLMNRAITRPIQAVTRVAQQVIQTEDFRIRADVTTQDEVGAMQNCGVKWERDERLKRSDKR
jgi:HAMP domain-containing protein